MTGAAALGGALALAYVGVRNHVLTSPLVLLGAPMLLSLAAAMQPITRIYGEWSLPTLADAVAIVAAPLAGIGAAVLMTQGGRTPRLERGTDVRPMPARLDRHLRADVRRRQRRLRPGMV